MNLNVIVNVNEFGLDFHHRATEDTKIEEKLWELGKEKPDEQ